MFDDYQVKRLYEIAESASIAASRDYVGIDADDIAGHMLEKAIRSEDRYEQHIDNDNWLWAVMYGEGIAYCNKQVRDFMHFSDEYYYTPKEIRELLKRAYSGEVQLDETIVIDEVTIAMMDLNAAFNQLGYRDKDLIARKLGQGEKLQNAERLAYYRATERLSAILNSHVTANSKLRVHHEGPGGRKVLSNAQSINKTRSQESG